MMFHILHRSLRPMLVLALFVIVPLVVGLGLSAIQKIYEMSLQEKVVTPIWIQNGYIPDAALEKQISPRPYVPTTQEALNELWTGLKLPGKSPTIDFSRLLVIVLTDRGANIPQATYIVDSWGNLRMTSRISTLIG